MANPNPYEAPREATSKGRLRLATVLVVVMLALLVVACGALAYVAYMLQGLG